MACTCKVGPGKFQGESARTFMAWEQLMNGCSDDDIGHYAFFKAPLMFDADAHVVIAAQDYGYCDECIAAANENDCYGFGIYESDQGFVYGAEYATQEEYDAAIARAESESSEDDSDA